MYIYITLVVLLIILWPRRHDAGIIYFADSKHPLNKFNNITSNSVCKSKLLLVLEVNLCWSSSWSLLYSSFIAWVDSATISAAA